MNISELQDNANTLCKAHDRNVMYADIVKLATMYAASEVEKETKLALHVANENHSREIAAKDAEIAKLAATLNFLLKHDDVAYDNKRLREVLARIEWLSKGDGGDYGDFCNSIGMNSEPPAPKVDEKETMVVVREKLVNFIAKNYRYDTACEIANSMQPREGEGE